MSASGATSTPPRGPAYITWEDAEQMPDNGRRHEAIGGELYGTPRPSIEHQRICLQLCVKLSDLLGMKGEVVLGPVGVVFPATEEGVQPDLLCVSPERRDILSDPWILGVPDLVVEVTSPTTAHRDRGVKRKLYERQGVEQYWIVDPDSATVEVWTFGERPSEAPGFHRYAERLPVHMGGEALGEIDLAGVFA